MTRNERSLDTLLAQGGRFLDRETGAVVPPIHPATTFARDDRYETSGYTYSRDANPTVAHVEEVLAELEGAEDALVFSSGMAAVATFFDSLGAGDHVAAPRVMYHGAADLLRRLGERRGVEVSFFDASEPGALEAAVRPGRTSVVWIETCVNPTWDVIDVRAAAGIARDAGAVLGVDATATPPVTLRALDLGADIVFHSATKYLAGHSDLLAGVLATRAADERWQEIGRRARAWAACPARSRPGCCCAACAPSICAMSARPRTRSPSPGISRAAPASRRCFIRGSNPMPGTRPRSGRWRRLRGHALAAGRRRRGRREADCDAHKALRAGDLARRRREPDRAPGDGGGAA